MRISQDELVTLTRAPRAGADFPRRVGKSPLIRAAAAFTTAGICAVVALTSAGDSAVLRAVFIVVAGLGAVAGALTLFRSVAVQNIALLRRRILLLEDDLARATAAIKQIDEALSLLRHVHRDGRARAEADDFVDNVLASARTRLASIHGEKVRIYLVRCTPSHYIVAHRAGDSGLPVGKSCPADRPLEEMLEDLAPHWYAVPLVIDGGEAGRLALLSHSTLRDEDESLIRQLAVVLELAATPPARVSTLRAV